MPVKTPHEHWQEGRTEGWERWARRGSGLGWAFRITNPFGRCRRGGRHR